MTETPPTAATAESCSSAVSTSQAAACHARHDVVCPETASLYAPKAGTSSDPPPESNTYAASLAACFANIYHESVRAQRPPSLTHARQDDERALAPKSFISIIIIFERDTHTRARAPFSPKPR